MKLGTGRGAITEARMAEVVNGGREWVCYGNAHRQIGKFR